jgi:hypothetical protein
LQQEGGTEEQSATNLYSATAPGVKFIIKLQWLSPASNLKIDICASWTFNEYPAIANTFVIGNDTWTLPANYHSFRQGL